MDLRYPWEKTHLAARALAVLDAPLTERLETAYTHLGLLIPEEDKLPDDIATKLASIMERVQHDRPTSAALATLDETQLSELAGDILSLHIHITEHRTT